MTTVEASDPGGHLPNSDVAKHDSLCGDYEKYYAIQSDDIVLDLGAHVGYFSEMVCAKGARAIAFEPHPENFKYLNQRLIGKPAIAINRAAADFTGETLLYHCDINSGAHSLFKNQHCSGETHRIGAIDIGSFLVGVWMIPDFIKVDTEGSEFLILKSLFDARIMKPMAMEVHSHELYSQCRTLAEANNMQWLPETSHVGICYCNPKPQK